MRNLNKNAKNTGLAIAAAAMMAAAPVSFADEHAESHVGQGSSADLGECHGVNACKGQSACATADSACKGHNGCKGEGFAKTTAAACEEKGGEFKKS